MDRSVELIKSFEGYQSKAYWDVNHWRVGYGSDTTTAPDGTVSKVTKDTVTTSEAAARDLARRVPDFQANVIANVGQDAWNALSDNQKAAITSVAYNYGGVDNLPSLKKAIVSGDAEQISSAILKRSGDNGGINADRRTQEASFASGHPIPKLDVPQSNFVQPDAAVDPQSTKQLPLPFPGVLRTPITSTAQNAAGKVGAPSDTGIRSISINPNGTAVDPANQAVLDSRWKGGASPAPATSPSANNPTDIRDTAPFGVRRAPGTPASAPPNWAPDVPTQGTGFGSANDPRTAALQTPQRTTAPTPGGNLPSVATKAAGGAAAPAAVNDWAASVSKTLAQAKPAAPAPAPVPAAPPAVNDWASSVSKTLAQAKPAAPAAPAALPPAKVTMTTSPEGPMPTDFEKNNADFFTKLFSVGSPLPSNANPSSYTPPVAPPPVAAPSPKPATPAAPAAVNDWAASVSRVLSQAKPSSAVTPPTPSQSTGGGAQGSWAPSLASLTPAPAPAPVAAPRPAVAATPAPAQASTTRTVTQVVENPAYRAYVNAQSRPIGNDVSETSTHPKNVAPVAAPAAPPPPKTITVTKQVVVPAPKPVTPLAQAFVAAAPVPVKPKVPVGVAAVANQNYYQTAFGDAGSAHSGQGGGASNGYLF